MRKEELPCSPAQYIRTSETVFRNGVSNIFCEFSIEKCPEHVLITFRSLNVKYSADLRRSHLVYDVFGPIVVTGIDFWWSGLVFGNFMIIPLPAPQLISFSSLTA